MTDWAEELADCERIFIRASVSNRRIFFDYDDAILQKGITPTVASSVDSDIFRRRRSISHFPFPHAPANSI